MEHKVLVFVVLFVYPHSLKFHVNILFQTFHLQNKIKTKSITYIFISVDATPRYQPYKHNLHINTQLYGDFSIL